MHSGAVAPNPFSGCRGAFQAANPPTTGASLSAFGIKDFTTPAASALGPFSAHGSPFGVPTAIGAPTSPTIMIGPEMRFPQAEPLSSASGASGSPDAYQQEKQHQEEQGTLPPQEMTHNVFRSTAVVTENFSRMAISGTNPWTTTCRACASPRANSVGDHTPACNSCGAVST